MSASILTLDWQLPVVALAGVFPMIVPGCNQSYSHDTFALHLHDYPGEMWIGGKRLVLQPGDITLTPSHVKSQYALPKSGSHLCIHFRPSAPSRARKTKIKLPFFFRLGPLTVAVRDRFWRVTDYARQFSPYSPKPAPPSAAAASASLQELLLWLYLHRRRSKNPQRASLAESALAKLNHAIDTSLAKPMLIEELAANVGLSSAYVARLFVQRYGMTLQHYLLLRRIELARHLLISSDLLVSHIARRVGIPDPQYFNKQFRRVTGKSPVSYRCSKSKITAGLSVEPVHLN